jgi:GDPmannose 4,6-dehydratase
VREFVEKAFGLLDLDYRRHVEHDPRYERPAEVDLLLGDASKAKKMLGWDPKVGFDELVEMMVDSDLEAAGEEQALVQHNSTRAPRRGGEGT